MKPESLPLGERHDMSRRGISKRLRAILIDRIRPQRRANDCPTRRQRPSRPPDMQCRDMSMSYRLLSPCMGGDSSDGEVNFDQTFGIGHSSISPSEIAVSSRGLRASTRGGRFCLFTSSSSQQTNTSTSSALWFDLNLLDTILNSAICVGPGLADS